MFYKPNQFPIFFIIKITAVRTWWFHSNSWICIFRTIPIFMCRYWGGHCQGVHVYIPNCMGQAML